MGQGGRGRSCPEDSDLGLAKQLFSAVPRSASRRGNYYSERGRRCARLYNASCGGLSEAKLKISLWGCVCVCVEVNACFKANLTGDFLTTAATAVYY